MCASFDMSDDIVTLRLSAEVAKGIVVEQTKIEVGFGNFEKERDV